METVDIFALAAVTLCIIGTVECAKAVRKHPALLASLVFFGLSWALLLPFYSLQADPASAKEQGELADMLAAYSAILLMLTAVPLRSGPADATSVWAMRALYLIVVPHNFAFVPQVQALLHQRTVGIVHLFLAAAGFFLITRALWFLTKECRPMIQALWWISLVVATAYLGAQIWYGSNVIRHPQNYAPMPDSYKWLFIVLKMAFCPVFLLIVFLHANSQPINRQHAGGTSVTRTGNAEEKS